MDWGKQCKLDNIGLEETQKFHDRPIFYSLLNNLEERTTVKENINNGGCRCVTLLKLHPYTSRLTSTFSEGHIEFLGWVFVNWLGNESWKATRDWLGVWLTQQTSIQNRIDLGHDQPTTGGLSSHHACWTRWGCLWRHFFP